MKTTLPSIPTSFVILFALLSIDRHRHLAVTAEECARPEDERVIFYSIEVLYEAEEPVSCTPEEHASIAFDLEQSFSIVLKAAKSKFVISTDTFVCPEPKHMNRRRRRYLEIVKEMDIQSGGNTYMGTTGHRRLKALRFLYFGGGEFRNNRNV